MLDNIISGIKQELFEKPFVNGIRETTVPYASIIQEDTEGAFVEVAEYFNENGLFLGVGPDPDVLHVSEREKNIITELKTFIAGDLKNKWISDHKMSVYVRKGKRLLGGRGEFYNTLDIANIEVAEEFQRQGLFSWFVNEAHKLHPWQATYIESIQSPIVEEWCIRNNWKQQPMSMPPSFYKLKEEK